MTSFDAYKQLLITRITRRRRTRRVRNVRAYARTYAQSR